MAQSMGKAILLAAIVGGLGGAAAGGDKTPKFKIATKRDNDKVQVNVDKDRTIFSIHSPFGISQATIERSDEKWPDAVMLRLHLKGLESFKASNGKNTLNASVSSQNDAQRVRLWKDGMENAPLDAKSPFWMEIRMLDSAGKPAKTIPLKDGAFEMQLPKAFFEGNPKSITVQWIDFHRN